MFLLLTLSITLAGCASGSRGQPKDTDFLTKHLSANLPVTEAYANLQQGFRYCGVENYGFPDCRPPEKDGAVLCNVYPDKAAPGKTSRLSGKIELSPASMGTKAVLRVHKDIPNNETILTAWEIFMSGRVQEACP